MTKENPNNIDLTQYRLGVGVVLFNKNGHVLIAQRTDYPDIWQMPQGGIDEDETPELAIFREMEEEIGTCNAEILDVIEEWIFYDFPKEINEARFGAKFKGQRQKWIALKFLGEDTDINLELDTTPEFQDWKWVELHEIIEYVVPFKKHIYERVIEKFSKHTSLIQG